MRVWLRVLGLRVWAWGCSRRKAGRVGRARRRPPGPAVHAAGISRLRSLALVVPLVQRCTSGTSSCLRTLRTAPSSSAPRPEEVRRTAPNRSVSGSSTGKTLSDHPCPPGTGVGIGNFESGTCRLDVDRDPHNILLREAAEGGYPLLALFGVLVLGTEHLLVLRRAAHLSLAHRASRTGHAPHARDGRRLLGPWHPGDRLAARRRALAATEKSRADA